MKTRTFDKVTGAPNGELEIPDEVMNAAYLVHRWMEENYVDDFLGLKLRTEHLVGSKLDVDMRDMPAWYYALGAHWDKNTSWRYWTDDEIEEYYGGL
jgi:hypothetical protein